MGALLQKSALAGRRAVAKALLYLALAAPLGALADLTGKVVGVADGDTLTVLIEREQIKVRLAGIDAPEKSQAFGNRAKQSLAELCLGEVAHLAEQGKDRYKRTLAQVTCNQTDVNAEQVRRGFAWAYRKYLPADSPLFAIEQKAQEEQLGLWRDPAPMPPWEWRRIR